MQPAGRVFFAGEHTAPEEYRGYMEGAIRSVNVLLSRSSVLNR